MPALSIGVIYSKGQSRVRRWIVPDSDKELQSVALMPGEAMLTLPAGQNYNLNDLNAQVQIATGKTPVDDTCAVVDAQGNILAQVKADPAIDTHPDGDVVITGGPMDASATYNAKTKIWTQEIPEKITPAGTRLRDGTVLAEDKVDAAQTITITVDEATGARVVDVAVAEAAAELVRP